MIAFFEKGRNLRLVKAARKSFFLASPPTARFNYINSLPWVSRMSSKKQNRSSTNNNFNVTPKSLNSPSVSLSSSTNVTTFQAKFSSPSSSSSSNGVDNRNSTAKSVTNGIETRYILLSPLDLVALSLVPEDYAVIQGILSSSSSFATDPTTSSITNTIVDGSSSSNSTTIILPKDTTENIRHDTVTPAPRPLYIGKVWPSKKQEKGTVSIPSMNVFFPENDYPPPPPNDNNSLNNVQLHQSLSPTTGSTTTPRKATTNVTSPLVNRSKGVSSPLQRTPSSSSSSMSSSFSPSSSSSFLHSFSYPVTVHSLTGIHEQISLQPAGRINVRKVHRSVPNDGSLQYIHLHPTIVATFATLLKGLVIPSQGSTLRMKNMDIELLPFVSDQRYSDSTVIESFNKLSYVYITSETVLVSVHVNTPQFYDSTEEVPTLPILPSLSSSSSAAASFLPRSSTDSFPLPSPSSSSFIDTSTASSSSLYPAPLASSSIGGLDEPIHKLRELITTALHRPELYTQFALRPPRGTLLVGPPGTGKTSIARDLAQQLNLPLFVINGAEIMSSYVGESEAQLRSVFRRAARASPALIFLDEVDSLCPAREGSSNSSNMTNEVETRLVATLLALMDGVNVVLPPKEKDSTRNGTLSLPDELSLTPSSSSRIFIIGATNRASALDPAIRRPGRFDTEIYIGIPSAWQRYQILQKCLQRYPYIITDEELHQLANSLHGYVGADIAALCREAALTSLRRQVTGYGTTTAKTVTLLEEKVAERDEEVQGITGGMKNLCIDYSASAVVPSPVPSSGILPSLPSSSVVSTVPFTSPSVSIFTPLTVHDLDTAIRHVQPSALREITIEVPHVLWSDIGGQEEAKQRLREAVEWPLRHSEAFTRMGIRPPRGALLYGPPGCSKTLLAKAMATESQLNFIAIKGPELFSKYVGDSEKAVAEVFNRARAVAPCIVFFDEFDALAPVRGSGDDGNEGDHGPNVNTRVVAQLLQELDGIASLRQVVIVAATNRPDLIDPALLRPGRIDRRVYVGLPDRSARQAIVRMQLERVPHVCTDEEQENIVAEFEGYTGAEIVGIFREAAVQCVREAMQKIEKGSIPNDETTTINETTKTKTLRLNKQHIDSARQLTPQQVTMSMLKFYRDYGANK